MVVYYGCKVVWHERYQYWMDQLLFGRILMIGCSDRMIEIILYACFRCLSSMCFDNAYRSNEVYNIVDFPCILCFCAGLCHRCYSKLVNASFSYFSFDKHYRTLPVYIVIVLWSRDAFRCRFKRLARAHLTPHMEQNSSEYHNSHKTTRKVVKETKSSGKVRYYCNPTCLSWSVKKVVRRYWNVPKCCL